MKHVAGHLSTLLTPTNAKYLKAMLSNDSRHSNGDEFERFSHGRMAN